MTKARLKAIVADYSASVPDREITHGGLTVVRVFSPIEQMISSLRMQDASLLALPICAHIYLIALIEVVLFTQVTNLPD